ncbi:PREDICTED: transmembrane protein 132E-like, partial [Tinamus guttatus]|uniref:transmembrane protein 132E-like n=1 Tax=Tinamus guttatus TaxID=94827 RepID=UPI00052EF8DB
MRGRRALPGPGSEGTRAGGSWGAARIWSVRIGRRASPAAGNEADGEDPPPENPCELLRISIPSWIWENGSQLHEEQGLEKPVGAFNRFLDVRRRLKAKPAGSLARPVPACPARGRAAKGRRGGTSGWADVAGPGVPCSPLCISDAFAAASRPAPLQRVPAPLRSLEGVGGCGSVLMVPNGDNLASPMHPLLRIGSITLLQPPAGQLLQEHRLDGNVFIRLPDKPLKPGEVLSIFLYLMANSTVEHFTLRVKAKKGVNLLTTKSRSLQWLVTSELLTGGKHSTATVDVSRVDGAGPRDGDSSAEIMQLDFEMENFTSQSVTRRIMWHIDYRGRNPPPDLEKVVTELTVIQRDIRAIVPLAMDTEIINTAILTGRTVAIPVKVIAIELSGVIVDVSAMVECKSNNEDIIK